MGKHLVLAGAGHAHMVTLQNIAEFCRHGHKVTVIGPTSRHYYSGMGPGMFGGTYTAAQISFNSRAIVERQGGKFIRDSVVGIEPDSTILQLASGRELAYDILSCNCGSSADHAFIAGDDCPVYSVKPIENLVKARDYICAKGRDNHLRIAIIGGGPSAAEIAGNVVQLVAQEKLKTAEITIFSRSAFMARFSSRVQQACSEYLRGQGVVIRENNPVVSAENGVITIQRGGATATANVIFAAQGIHPLSLFKRSGLATGPDGGLLVNAYLQSVRHPEIFGGGDCVYFSPQPLDKVGVYAVRQNPVLYHNLLAALAGKRLQPFTPGGGYLLIFNLGKGYGVLQKGVLFWQGRLAFAIKDRIDRRFMNRFK